MPGYMHTATATSTKALANHSCNIPVNAVYHCACTPSEVLLQQASCSAKRCSHLRKVATPLLYLHTSQATFSPHLAHVRLLLLLLLPHMVLSCLSSSNTISSWCGRLGEFVMHTGPSNSEASVAGRGAILHLWRAALAEPDAAGSAQQQQQEGAITPGEALC